MSKFAELPDGTRLEFPDDTEDSIIQKAVKTQLGVSDEEPSQLKALAKSVVESTLPALGGVVGGGGAMLLGSPLIVASGPAAPVTGLGLGLAGGMAGSSAVQAIQDKVTSYIPESVKEAAGWGKGVREAEEAAHPMTDFTGKLLPNLLAFRPGAIPDIVTAGGKVIGSGTQRALAGGISSGVETASQLYEGKDLDWRKIAAAGAFDAVNARTTKLGEKLMFSPHSGNTPAAHDPDAAIADPNHGTLNYMVENAHNQVTHLGNTIQEISQEIGVLQQQKQLAANAPQAVHDAIDAKLITKHEEMAKAAQDKKDLEAFIAQQAGPQQPPGGVPPAAAAGGPVPPQGPGPVPPQGGAPVPPAAAQAAAPNVPPAAAAQVAPTPPPVAPNAPFTVPQEHLNAARIVEENARLRAAGEEPEYKGRTLEDIEAERLAMEKGYEVPPDTGPLSARGMHDLFKKSLEKMVEKPFSEKKVAEMIEERVGKLEGEYPLSKDAKHLITKEIQILKDIQSGKISAKDVIHPDRSAAMTPDEHQAAIIKALDQTIKMSDMRGGLQEMAANSNSKILKSVSNFLLNNKTIGQFTKLAYSKDLVHDAQVRQTKDGTEIDFQPGKVKQTTYVHEAIHAATSGMMKAFAMGHTHFSPTAKTAMTRLSDLHATLRSQHGDYIIDQYTSLLAKDNPTLSPEQIKAQATHDINEFLKNDRELLAYGMSHEPFMGILDSIKFHGRPALSNMYDDIAKALGSVDPKSHSALRELLHNGEKIISESHGQGVYKYTKAMADLDTIDNLSSYRAANGDIGTNGWQEFKKRFGPNAGSSWQGLKKAGLHVLSTNAFPRFFKHPFIDKTAALIRKGDRMSEMLQSRIFNGDPSAGAMDAHLKGSILIPMSKAKGDLYGKRGLNYAFNLLTNKEITDLMPGFNKAFAERFDPRVDFDKHFPGINAKQKEFLHELYRAGDLLHEADLARAMRAGHNAPKYIPGYFIKNSMGKYYVDVMANGVIIGREWTNSSKAADAIAARIIKKTPEVQASVGEREAFADYSGLVDALEKTQEQFRNVPGLDPVSFLQAKIDTINLNASDVGGHHKHRGALFGFGGDTGGTIHEMAQNFKESVQSGAREYTKALRAREIASDYAHAVQQNPNVPNNIAEASRFFLDHHLGRTAQGGFAKMLEKGFSDPINKATNNIYYSLFGKSPTGNVIENTFNQIARLGYEMNLTSAPVTWISQIMATMNSMRMIAQLSNNPATGLMHGMSGLAKTMVGYRSPDSEAGLKWMAQNTDVFHKTISHDIMTASQMNKPSSKFNTAREYTTGTKFTEWSDSFSRVASWQIAMDILKSQGVTGPTAWKKAAAIMTENLFPMGREHLPAMYKELGFIGTAIAPLKSYTHHLASNLIADAKQVATGKLDSKLKDTYILGMNMFSILLQGGLLGAPFLADYEWIRQQMVKAGWINQDTLPNYTKFATSQPKELSHGAISAITGGAVDIGQSNRYRSIFEPLGDATSINIAASMPLSHAANIAGAVPTIAKDMFSNVSDPAARSAWDKVLPRGVAKGVKEDIYNKDDMVPFGKRGEALVPRGTEERVAKYMGSSSMAESRARTIRNDSEINKESIMNQKKTAYDLILSESPSDKAAGYKLIRRIADADNVSYDEALRQIKSLRLSQVRPSAERSFLSNSGTLTTKPQARNLRELLQYGEYQ